MAVNLNLTAPMLLTQAFAEGMVNNKVAKRYIKECDPAWWHGCLCRNHSSLSVVHVRMPGLPMGQLYSCIKVAYL